MMVRIMICCRHGSVQLKSSQTHLTGELAQLLPLRSQHIIMIRTASQNSTSAAVILLKTQLELQGIAL